MKLGKSRDTSLTTVSNEFLNTKNLNTLFVTNPMHDWKHESNSFLFPA